MNDTDTPDRLSLVDALLVILVLGIVFCGTVGIIEANRTDRHTERSKP